MWSAVFVFVSVINTRGRARLAGSKWCGLFIIKHASNGIINPKRTLKLPC